jgi:hypothetical protein
MRNFLLGSVLTLALAVGIPAAQAQNQDGDNAREQDGVPKLDHVFVIVLENHNSFTSFGSNGIIGNPQAPNITALWNKYNVATNYNGAWHPSLPNYLASSMTIQRPFPPISRRQPTPRSIAGWRIVPRLRAS